MSDIEQACAATPEEELESYIMDPCQPKNEQEWWACREIERLRKERDEARKEVEERDEWLQIVDTLPLDEFDRLGDYWVQRLAIVKMSQAIASVFVKFAPEPIMQRFREGMRNIMHQAFVEGCIAGARNERARQALKDTPHD